MFYVEIINQMRVGKDVDICWEFNSEKCSFLGFFLYAAKITMN